MRKAIFIDKDGTLIENVPFNVDPGKIVPVPGALNALATLYRAGYEIVVVSNQAGIALGKFHEEDLRPVERTLSSMLAGAGARLLAFYTCPHHPAGTVSRYAVDCTCRKPRAGMLHRARREFDIDLASSWMIGDILDDVEAGHTAGCRTILLDRGHETEWRFSPSRLPGHILSDYASVVRVILQGNTLEEKDPPVRREEVTYRFH